MPAAWSARPPCSGSRLPADPGRARPRDSWRCIEAARCRRADRPRRRLGRLVPLHAHRRAGVRAGGGRRVAGRGRLASAPAAARGAPRARSAAQALAADRRARRDQLRPALPRLRLCGDLDGLRRAGDLQLGGAVVRGGHRRALARRPDDAGARRRPRDRLRRHRLDRRLQERAACRRHAAAVLACLVATFCYGLSPILTKRHLSGVPPLAVATGSQLVGAVLLAVPGGVRLAGHASGA